MPDKNMQNGQPGTGGQPNGKEPPSGEERPDGEERPAQGGFGGASLLTQNNSFTIANSDGAALYTGEAAYNASFVFFSSADLSDGESYTLTSGETRTVRRPPAAWVAKSRRAAPHRKSPRGRTARITATTPRHKSAERAHRTSTVISMLMIFISPAFPAIEPHPVKRTEKNYKIFPTGSLGCQSLFYAAR